MSARPAPIRIALIGCGARARDHLDAWAGVPGATAVACCAPSPTRRDPLADQYRLTPYADPAEMLRHERPDVVHLITGPAHRVALMTLVSDAGVAHAMVEKPAAVDVAGWTALRALATHTATRFAFCHQLRGHRHLARLRRAAAAGQFGPTPRLDLSCGMNLAGQGTHLIHYGRSLLPAADPGAGDARILRVHGQAGPWTTDDPDHPAPVWARAQLSFDQGSTATLTSGPDAPRCGPDAHAPWPHVRIAIDGEHGRGLFEEFGRFALHSPAERAAEDFAGFDAARADNLAAQRRLYQDLLAGHMPTGLGPTLHEWHAVLALYRSSLDAAPVDLAGFEPDEDLTQRLARGHA